MTLGIMQPYFFPYIGYFQLIKAVDTYVNLDHVSFMKRSYMTRNLIKDGVQINLQVSGGSQNKNCNEVFVNFEHDYINKFLKTLKILYSKNEGYEEIMDEIITPHFIERHIPISEFNLGLIESICKKLEIDTRIISTSTEFENTHLKKEKGLQSISKQLNADSYINAIGGTKLYSKEDFKKAGIDLLFIKMSDVELEIPYASILHQLMSYPVDHIKNQINKYELI
jgi:hypothetical protein